jgi:hypothetical protein
MFYDKNPNIHRALADKFNRKKTLSNDINRINQFYQTNKMINHSIKINFNKPIEETIIKEQVLPSNSNSLLGFDGLKISTPLNLHFNNEDETKFIHKIIQKEILVPTHSENDKFDFSNIHKNINHSLDLNINLFENIYDADIDKLHKRNIKVINNVYQESYTEDKKPTGFGDFIRGCYFLLQFCKKYNFQANIIINHPLSLFLEKHYKYFLMNQFINKEIFSSIPMFVNSNWKDSELDSNGNIINVITSNKTLSEIISYLYNLKVSKNSIFMYNIFFPLEEVEEKDKLIMREMLEPNLEMKEYVSETLNGLKLNVEGYSVIHIRAGDSYLTEESKLFDSLYFKRLSQEIFIILNNNPTTPFLLIADNNEIKYLLGGIYTNLKIVYNDITHLGEGNVLERNRIKNTLLDFYLMSKSNSIYSFTSYIHGSGFSLWCATTYNIPYYCKHIKANVN